MGVWAANYASKEAMDKGVGWADPAVYAKMTDLVFDNAAQPRQEARSRIAVHQRVRRKLKLSDAEWTKAKAASSKYALG